MIVDLKCKFCGYQGRVIIDDDYAAMGDPQGLYKLYCCDPCGDFRTRRRLIVDKLKWNCNAIISKQFKDKDELERMRKNLKTLLLRYMVNLAKHRGLDSPEWDDAILDGLMSRPASLGSVLGTIAGMIKQERLL